MALAMASACVLGTEPEGLAGDDDDDDDGDIDESCWCSVGAFETGCFRDHEDSKARIRAQ